MPRKKKPKQKYSPSTRDFCINEVRDALLRNRGLEDPTAAELKCNHVVLHHFIEKHQVLIDARSTGRLMGAERARTKLSELVEEKHPWGIKQQLELGDREEEKIAHHRIAEMQASAPTIVYAIPSGYFIPETQTIDDLAAIVESDPAVTGTVIEPSPVKGEPAKRTPFLSLVVNKPDKPQPTTLAHPEPPPEAG